MASIKSPQGGMESTQSPERKCSPFNIRVGDLTASSWQFFS